MHHVRLCVVYSGRCWDKFAVCGIRCRSIVCPRQTVIDTRRVMTVSRCQILSVAGVLYLPGNAIHCFVFSVHFRMCNISNFQAWRVAPKQPGLSLWWRIMLFVVPFNNRREFNTVIAKLKQGITFWTTSYLVKYTSIAATHNFCDICLDLKIVCCE